MKESEEKVPGKSESRPAVVDRRKFLQGAAAGSVATLVASAGAIGGAAFAAPSSAARRPRATPRRPSKS